MPGFGAGVLAMRHNLKLGLRVAGIGKSVNVELLDKHFGRDEELHRAENAAVVREVAGASSRKHVKVEGVVYADDERVRRSCVDEVRNVESKGSVTFASVFAGELAVDPNRGGVENGGKLNSNCGAAPAFGNVEIALIPRNAPILGKRRMNLPGVRNSDGNPILCGGLCREPIAVETCVFRVGLEEPFAVEARRLVGAGGDKSFCRERFGGRSGNAYTQGRSANEELAARIQKCITISVANRRAVYEIVPELFKLNLSKVVKNERSRDFRRL